jgi:undecaprenyl-diphosphatase
MLDFLIQLDRSLLFFINQQTANVFFDWLMPILREKKTWIPLYIIFVIGLIRTYKSDSWWMILSIILCIVFTDQMASTFFKPLIHRLRPCNAPLVMEHLRLLLPCGSGYSFFSSHAANHTALALLLSYYFRHKKWLTALLVLWAASIMYAQVYVAYHYPTDILAGVVCGIIGFIMVKALTQNKFQKLQA